MRLYKKVQPPREVMGAKLATVVVLLCFKSAFGQMETDIEMKYGKRMDVYSVSQHIWMTPDYARDGQVCRVWLFPKRIEGNTNYLSKKLPFEELREVLNSLVPLDQRGAKQQSFGVTATGRPAAWTTYPYEKVTFTFVSSFTPTSDDSPRLKKGEFVFPGRNIPAGGGLKNSAPTADDFLNSKSSATEIVTVQWNDRKCAVAQNSVDADVDLAQKRLANVQIEASGIAPLFSRLALSYDIPIGLEIAQDDDEWAIYRLDMAQGTLADLLNQFVSSHDQYAWKIVNGVVNVFPKTNYRDAVLAELLAVEIENFSVKEKTSCAGLGDALIATPEIRRIVETHRMKYRSQDISGFYIQQLGQKFSLTVSNMKLKATRQSDKRKSRS